MVLNNRKNHKQMENGDVGLGEDRISNLPTELVYRILSFLATKCGMSTCILSKRWKYLSNSIPTIDFREWRTEKNSREEKNLETNCLMNVLETVLYLHEKPKIQKFYLESDEFIDDSRFSRWISSITKRKVEELGLSINISRAFIFPLSFFTCDSLTLLNLSFKFDSATKFIIPNAVYFPKLKILRLRHLSFMDETFTRKLFSNCPILEELRLSYFRMFEGLSIVNPALKHLSIISCKFPALKGSSIIEISAPNLLTISCKIGFSPPTDFVLGNFPSLVKADVNFLSPRAPLVKLLEKISRAKRLKITFNSFLVLLSVFPAFNNLINLEVSSYFYCTSTSTGPDSVSTVARFFRFLQLSPKLKSIVFTQSIRICVEQADDFLSIDPKYQPLQLKSIKFKYFVGEEEELNAVRIFLKYATFLETVIIVASPGLSEDHEKQINAMRLLLMLPKPANCVVKFLMSSEKA